MARNDNTLMWLALAGVGGYFLWQYEKTKAMGVPGLAIAPGGNPNYTTLPVSVTSSNEPGPDINNNYVAPVPNVYALAPNNSVPVVPFLRPGQGLAINANGYPLVDSSGSDITFQPLTDHNYLKYDAGNYPGAMVGDCV